MRHLERVLLPALLILGFSAAGQVRPAPAPSPAPPMTPEADLTLPAYQYEVGGRRCPGLACLRS
jgi:hypothetical protein